MNQPTPDPTLRERIKTIIWRDIMKGLGHPRDAYKAADRILALAAGAICSVAARKPSRNSGRNMESPSKPTPDPTLRERIAEALIEKWSNDPELQVGVPYRRMATEAAALALVPVAPLGEPDGERLFEMITDAVRYAGEYPEAGEDEIARVVMGRVLTPPVAPETPVDTPATQRDLVLAWLGYWRDRMPGEAVTALQDVLGVAPETRAEDWIRSLPRAEPLPQKWDDDNAPETREPERLNHFNVCLECGHTEVQGHHEWCVHFELDAGEPDVIAAAQELAKINGETTWARLKGSTAWKYKMDARRVLVAAGVLPLVAPKTREPLPGEIDAYFAQEHAKAMGPHPLDADNPRGIPPGKTQHSDGRGL